MSLDEIRKIIDEIDKQLIPLIKKRMECSLEVAEIKRKENLAVFDPARESEIIERVKKNVGDEYGKYVSQVYRHIMSTSRDLQNDRLNIK